MWTIEQTRDLKFKNHWKCKQKKRHIVNGKTKICNRCHLSEDEIKERQENYITKGATVTVVFWIDSDEREEYSNEMDESVNKKA